MGGSVEPHLLLVWGACVEVFCLSVCLHDAHTRHCSQESCKGGAKSRAKAREQRVELDTSSERNTQRDACRLKVAASRETVCSYRSHVALCPGCSCVGFALDHQTTLRVARKIYYRSSKYLIRKSIRSPDPTPSWSFTSPLLRAHHLQRALVYLDSSRAITSLAPAASSGAVR